MAEPETDLLLLGGNMGDPRLKLAHAEALIAARAGRIVARSRDHWTEPWGFTDERLFLNRALLLETHLEPEALMAVLLGIEAKLGRTRDPERRNAARVIDIDILLIGDRVMDTPCLQVPHPRMHERAFVLEPAADIAPDWMHPVLKKTVLHLLHELHAAAAR